MNENIKEFKIVELSEFVSFNLGLDFKENRFEDLKRGVFQAALELGFKDSKSFVEYLLSKPLEKSTLNVLASHLTVEETYFFRDKEIFKTLEDNILPELINLNKKDKQLRIWSAGCSTGEEPYSVAILLNEIIEDLKSWNITILATDINLKSLKKAEIGLYSKYSFRECPLWILKKYFKETANHNFLILPEIKEKVTFSYLNLIEDIYPSLLNNTNAMDLIFLRNVLMYFKEEQARNTALKMFKSVKDGGYLITSPCEISQVTFKEFLSVNIKGRTFYKKDKEPETPLLSTQTLGSKKSDFIQELKGENRIEQKVDGLQIKEAKAISQKAGLKEAGTKKNEEESELTFKKALNYYKEGLYAKIIEEISPLTLKEKYNSKTTMLFIKACANSGKFLEALKWLKKLELKDKLNPEIYYLEAIIYKELKDDENAIPLLKKALYLEPQFVLAHFALFNILKKQGKANETQKQYQNLILLLDEYKQEKILPYSDDLTAGRLKEILQVINER